jgi:RNA polymerase sigma-70 factor (ECF subfamily)
VVVGVITPRLLKATMDVLAEQSADELWRAHADELLRFATVLAGPHDAYDIVADVMLSAGPAASAPTVTNRRAYLFRAVANRANDEHRSRKRRWRRDLAAVGPASTWQPDDFSDVRRAVSHLTVQQRAVVYLAYWEDRPEREIAEMLELSPGTVHKTLERARGTLRKALQ